MRGMGDARRSSLGCCPHQRCAGPPGYVVIQSDGVPLHGVLSLEGLHAILLVDKIDKSRLSCPTLARQQLHTLHFTISAAGEGGGVCRMCVCTDTRTVRDYEVGQWEFYNTWWLSMDTSTLRRGKVKVRLGR